MNFDEKNPFIPRHVTVSFFDVKRKAILIPSEENNYTSRANDGVITIDLKEESERYFLDVLLKMDSFNFSFDKKETVYKVADREYHDDGKRIFISLIAKEE